jgi:DNA polymerase V
MITIEIMGFRPTTSRKAPLFTMSVSAGIPVQTDDNIDKEIDLNEYLVERPAATFFARVKGDDMTEAGIFDGDILIVDSSEKPHDGRIVLAEINDQLTVKYFRDMSGEHYLESQDSVFFPLNAPGLLDAKILGSVTKIIHSV